MQTRKNSLLIVSIISLLLFVSVVYVIVGTQGTSFDETISNWATKMTSSFLLKVMNGISILGSTTFILLLTGLLGLFFLLRRDWNDFFFLFILSVGDVILSIVIKMTVQRERPGLEASHVEVFNYSLDIPSYSFPSGHTMRATMFFLFIAYLAIRYLYNQSVKTVVVIGSISIILLVAMSRIFLDAHYATDTLGAIFISTAWFFFCSYLFVRRDRFSDMYYINR